MDNFPLVYLLIVVDMGFVPGAFLSLSMHSRNQKLAVALAAALFAIPAAIALFFSKEISILASILEIGGIYYLKKQDAVLDINIVDDLGIEIKQYWPYLPKRKRERIAIEKGVAALIQDENRSFSIMQVYAVMERAYGERARELEAIITQETYEWARDLKREKTGKESYYKFDGGK